MKANRAAPWLRILALCTAVGLGGAYVWKQQQKAVPQGDQSAERPIESDSKSRDTAPPPSPVLQEQTDRLLLSGSKSGIFIEVKPEEPKERTLMPGSKSSVIGPVTLPAEEKKRILLSGSKGGILQLGPKIDLELPSPEKPNAPSQRTLLPGSKSPARILEPPKSDPVIPSPEIPVVPKERTLLPSSKSIPMPIFRERRVTPEDQPKPDEP